MNEQLDYEATKAALRAQATAHPTYRHGLSAFAWKWCGAASSLIVVACAVVLTVWATSGSSSVTLVPSGDHNDNASRSLGSTATERGTPVTLSTPLRPGQILTQADGTIVTNVEGIPTAFTSPAAAKAAALRELSRVSGRTITELPATTIAQLAAAPRAQQTRDVPSKPVSPPPPVVAPVEPAPPTIPQAPTPATSEPTPPPTSTISPAPSTVDPPADPTTDPPTGGGTATTGDNSTPGGSDGPDTGGTTKSDDS